MPFAALGRLETSYAVAAIKNARFGTEQYPIELYYDAEIVQIAAMRNRPFNGKRYTFRLGGYLTKSVKVEPSGDENVGYKFELWNHNGPNTDGGLAIDAAPDGSDSFVDGGFKFLYKAEALSDGVSGIKLHTVANDDWTSKKTIELDFDEPYDSAMKNYQALTAEVDTDQDNQNDSTLYTELWTNYPSTGNTYYMSGGIWLLVPNNKSQDKDYDFGGFVRSGYYRPDHSNSKVWRTVTGTARYKGSAAGLYTSLDENNDGKISRLLGKVTINADFGTTTERGILDGRIHDLTLDDKQVTGELLLNTDMDNIPLANYNIGNINGVNFTGAHYYVVLDGTSEETTTKALMGTIGGRGENGDTVVGTWGAYKVEDE